jgi:hypothetical protein
MGRLGEGLCVTSVILIKNAVLNIFVIEIVLMGESFRFTKPLICINIGLIWY